MESETEKSSRKWTAKQSVLFFLLLLTVQISISALWKLHDAGVPIWGMVLRNAIVSFAVAAWMVIRDLQ